MQMPFTLKTFRKKHGIKYALWILAFLAIESLLFGVVDRPLSDYAKRLGDEEHEAVRFFSAITHLGKGAWYLWPTGIATLFCAFLSRGQDIPARYRHLFGYIGTRALFLFATIGISGILVNVIKPFIGRARPVLWIREGLYGFEPLSFFVSVWNSMPSGHTTTAFALAFSLSKLYPKISWVWIGYGVLLGLSRVMVNAHYLSDVLAGAVLGWLVTELFYKHGSSPLLKIIFPIDKGRFS